MAGRLFVAGAGSWGTALAVLLGQKGTSVDLWARRAEVAEVLTKARVNEAYLPGIALPAPLTPTSAIEDIQRADGCLFVIPAQAARQYLTLLRKAAQGAELPVLLCSKGLERGTMAPMHQVLKEAWPEARAAVLSGPSFAGDVARGLPTAVTLAAQADADRQFWLDHLSTSSFRPYGSSDLLGVELGGAIKNVLAIACGISAGKGFGESAKAALIARGFAEMQRFAMAMGAKPETLGGLSGLGDLVLTCNSAQSRNFSLGVALGQGLSLQDHVASRSSVAEGAATAPALADLAAERGIDMPICQAVAAIIEGTQGVDAVIRDLMTRPLKSEG